jgi:hypothetical protein
LFRRAWILRHPQDGLAAALAEAPPAGAELADPDAGAEGDTADEGETDGDTEASADGDTDGEGDTDAEGEAEGDGDAEGDAEGEDVLPWAGPTRSGVRT